MRARVLGPTVLEVDGRRVRPPSGTIEDLLGCFLLCPNEVRPAGELVRWLWGSETDDEDDGRLRQRLYVAVSRLRAFLETGDGQGPGLGLVTEAGGYRLTADAVTLDRLAFEALARRGLAGDRDAARRALDLVHGDPYASVPPSPERDAQRAILLDLRRRVAAVAAEGPPLVQQLGRARFLPPQLDQDAVLARPRLLARVGPIGEAALVVVVAPAGFGKSVLLTQWAEAQPGPTAWLELDERDDEPCHLWDEVLTALEVAGVVDRAAIPPGAAPGSPLFRDHLGVILAAATTPIGLVLDDAHELTSETWEAEIRRLLALAPGRLTVAVGSRRPLPEPDGVLVRHVSADDLRLDGDETLSVVRLSDPTAEPGDVAALAQVAAGWPIVVSYLSRAGATLDGHDQSLRPLHEYVVDEVLEKAPAGVRDLLLDTAAVDRLSVELCDAVTGRTDAAEQIGWLRAQALLLGTGSGPTGWWRRHPLVAQALRERAARHAGVDIPTQHRRAGRWFLAQGLPEEALRHAIAGGDRPTIAATAGDVVWAAMARGEVQACRSWLQLIGPDSAIADRATHDLLMLAVQAWVEPELAAAWVEARRRHYGPDDDLMAMHVESHRHYLEGRPAAAREVSGRAQAIVGSYFERHPNRPGVQELIAGTTEISPFIDDILAGEIHHDDPRMAALADFALSDMPLTVVWILGEWAFLAWAEGDGDRAAALVDRAAPHLRLLDETSAHFGACRLLAATALVESDRTADREQQRRLGQRLAPMVPLFRALRWDVELVAVLLALHLTALRSGRLEDAGRWLAEADVLLDLCEDAALLDAARAQVGRARWTGGAAGDREQALTPQELAVLQHLQTGVTYAEIAHALGTSHHTVRSQAAAVYRKLGVRNRKGLRAHTSES